MFPLYGSLLQNVLQGIKKSFVCVHMKISFLDLIENSKTFIVHAGTRPYIYNPGQFNVSFI